MSRKERCGCRAVARGRGRRRRVDPAAARVASDFASASRSGLVPSRSVVQAPASPRVRAAAAAPAHDRAACSSGRRLRSPVVPTTGRPTGARVARRSRTVACAADHDDSASPIRRDAVAVSAPHCPLVRRRPRGHEKTPPGREGQAARPREAPPGQAKAMPPGHGGHAAGPRRPLRPTRTAARPREDAARALPKPKGPRSARIRAWQTRVSASSAPPRGPSPSRRGTSGAACPPPSAASSSCSPEGTARSSRPARRRRPRTAAASSARPRARRGTGRARTTRRPSAARTIRSCSRRCAVG